MKGKHLCLLLLPKIQAMAKQLVLALFGYCILLGSLVAQNNVDQPHISIELMNMNVLYMGIDNPIQVSVAGLSSSGYRVQTDKGSLINTGVGKYNLKVALPGEVTLSVYTKTGPAQLKKTFRVKRIPDPVPALGAKFTRSDTIGLGAFKAQAGIALLLENFDFDVKCDMIEYKITHIGADYEKGVMFTHSVRNKGARFSDEAIELINEAAPDDVFIFSEIKALCPGDVTPRQLNALVFFMESIGND